VGVDYIMEDAYCHVLCPLILSESCTRMLQIQPSVNRSVVEINFDLIEKKTTNQQ